MKKSQMELFGLAIVVVIIIFATMFLVIFFINKEPSETRRSFIESQVASGLIDTLIKTSVQHSYRACNGIKLSDLVRLCIAGGKCGGDDACDVVDSVIDPILDNTIREWTQDNYYFSWYIPKELGPPEIIKEKGSPCQGDTRFKEYIVPGTPKTRVNLEICS